MIPLNLKPDTAILKQFGTISLFGFGVLAAVAAWWWQLPTVGMVLAILGVVTFALRIVYLPGVKYIYVATTVLTYPIGFVISHVLLAVLYFILFTGIGGILKLLGKDPLARRLDRERPTYWQPVVMPAKSSSYFRQF